MYSKCSSSFQHYLTEFSKKCKSLRVGYTIGTILHHYHGHERDRQYKDRWTILTESNFDPTTWLMRDEIGLLQCTNLFPSQVKEKIVYYFQNRNEDKIDFYH